MNALADALTRELPADAVTTGASELDLHAADLSPHTPVRPDIVVYPSSTAEVATVLRIASRLGTPVVPYGAGTSVEGHVIPVAGGISLDLRRLDSILRLLPGDRTAVVQAGVTRLQLDHAAAEHGLTFPIDPGADATLGGMAATNAAGTTTIRFGKMRDAVLALEAVLPGGSIVRTGTRALKTSAGYDLTSLLVGSEGTLAVITELTIRLYARPEQLAALRASFPSIEGAAAAATQIAGMADEVHRIELLDSWTSAAVDAFSGSALLAADGHAVLLIELAGSRASVTAGLGLVRELVDAFGGHVTSTAHAQEDRARLWRARHDVVHALMVLAPGRTHRATDVCVPLSELAPAAEFAREELERLELTGGIFGHAGDGNLHVGLMLDTSNAAEMARADQFADAIVADALARGGTCTGEHGVGLGKITALEQEHGDSLSLLRGIKAVFDPQGIMNPGKVLRRAG